MAKKEITKLVKLQIAAGAASPSPPVGPALGQAGVNIMEFCKAFNDRTKDMEKGSPVPVIITVYKDKSFEFTAKHPPVSYLIKSAAGIKSGSKTPGKGDKAGKITRAQIRKIAEEKMVDMNCHTIESAMSQVEGQCRSMSVAVEG
ncbi:MAG: 50S ribosomal protein L11 [Rickettsiales bacterium]|jgi:large subunit ribosomal protein L11|nr:50S ribosomal protein L11 [Rickettsiales bacterium]